MNNLAQTVKAQGDLGRAHELHEQVLEARARLQGKEHPDTLTSMNNLAQTLRAQRRSAEAARPPGAGPRGHAPAVGQGKPEHPAVTEQPDTDAAAPRGSARRAHRQ